jgi:transposase
LALVNASTGAVVDQSVFPNTPPGLDRALAWIISRIDGRSAQRRGVGKTDALDAIRIARSVLAVDTSRLRWPRATGPRVVLRVLVVAREQMVSERTRAINALTALLRTIDLGVDGA